MHRPPKKAGYITFICPVSEASLLKKTAIKKTLLLYGWFQYASLIAVFAFDTIVLSFSYERIFEA